MLKRLRHQLKAFKTASEVIASRGEVRLSWRQQGGCHQDAVEGSTLVAQLRRREQERLREGDREHWRHKATPPAGRRRERELDLERQRERELQRFLPTGLAAGSGCGSGNGGGSGSDGNRAFPPEVSPIELWRQQQRRQQQRDERQRLEEQRLELRQRRLEEQQVLKRLPLGLPGVRTPRRTPSPLQCPAAIPAIKYRGMPLLGLHHLDRARAAAMSARRQELRVQRQLLEEERKDREVVPFAGPLHALARFRKF
ncbi:uncharacterized protein Dana_GF15972 [Drosophila ananassae]|uniref:Uncharacterized protein n=1 Tax=Drosophila ananassae TaxID=7217 RepID=B3N0Z9_DROAN|nr:uncharacterized protein LOC6498773 [Drosophila ananassae]EDV30034.1 uncharacterized protein Dana_GF15972 [Drosophila ananassae]